MENSKRSEKQKGISAAIHIGKNMEELKNTHMHCQNYSNGFSDSVGGNAIEVTGLL